MNKRKNERFKLKLGNHCYSIGAAICALLGVLGIHSAATAQRIFNPPAVNLTKIATQNPYQRVVYAAKFTCGIWSELVTHQNSGRTAAQLNKGIGAGPPLPPEHSTPPLSTNKPYYHDFQPGSYSTALNIFNPTLSDVTINVMVSSEGLASPQTLATRTIPSLDLVQLGCSDMEALLPPSSKGELVEGFFCISRSVADLQVQTVNTYTTMAAFQEFRGGFVDYNGVLQGDRIAGSNALAGAGAGAGGLGLGGSVDIETIHPMKVGL